MTSPARRSPATFTALLAMTLLLSACATSPTTYFYTLEPLAAAGLTTGGGTVRVGQVTVPELVDRPQMVLRSGANQVSLAEQRRWAESLRSAIARVVAANLATADSATSASTVDIDVVRFDSQLGVAVDLAASWRLRSATGIVRSGSMSTHEPAPGKDYADLAAAHSRALAELSRNIATAIVAKP
ncbi:PqiC family protein [Actimicrobium sp. CCC2.4]|uniref:PqiC family protein n=1 Tax=Actimicrobium sp. CCC2.4 TaxID=3048606 RepID=UPI002AC9ABA9|nr:PqiC family protein [Actimicrobium sp. CCC2.4]MEB0133995.1 PqiC family protein [Actimicrobium sp. CCC2.4]WPX31531.1 PqiC family protein [Actimicrobium sp. CCC2.4]